MPQFHRSQVMPDPAPMAEARARLVKTSPTPLELVGRSTAIARVHELVRRAALADGGVLLVADHGADVTSVAEELHARTRRAAAPFGQVDCASTDPTRLDEGLFGTAPESAPGDLEVVSRDSQIAASFGGTIFLRDVAELPASVQARLARIARDGEVRIDGQPVADGPALGGKRVAGPRGRRADQQVPRRSVPAPGEIADRPAAAPRSRRRCAGAGVACARRLVRRARLLASHDDAGGARAARGADVVREPRRASRGGRTRRGGNTARASFRSKTCCRHSISNARPRASCRPDSFARPGCGSNATTSPPCCSTTTGEWRKPRPRSASSGRISIGRRVNSAFRSRGRPSNVPLHRTEAQYESSCLAPVCVSAVPAVGESGSGVAAADAGGARRAADRRRGDSQVPHRPAGSAEDHGPRRAGTDEQLSCRLRWVHHVSVRRPRARGRPEPRRSAGSHQEPAVAARTSRTRRCASRSISTRARASWSAAKCVSLEKFR